MRRLIPFVLSILLVAAGCGDDSQATPSTEGSETTMTTEDGPDSAQSGGTTAAPSPSQGSPADPEIVGLVTADGLELEGTLYPAGDVWVILAHMRPADRSSWNDFAPLLQAAGLTVLSYDNRGYGGSAGVKEPFDLIGDARAALALARDRGASTLAFGGASMNGAAAITLAASEDFAAVFALSAVPSFPSAPDAAALVGQIDEPALFVAAEDDGDAADNARGFATAAPNSTLEVLTAGGHGTAMLGADPELAGRILGWLEAALG